MSAMNSMTNAGFRPNPRMLAAGAMMTGLGAMVAAVGACMVGMTLATAGRKWVNSWETPPAEMAQRTFAQVRTASQAASHAGMDAWRNGSPSVN